MKKEIKLLYSGVGAIIVSGMSAYLATFIESGFSYWLGTFSIFCGIGGAIVVIIAIALIFDA